MDIENINSGSVIPFDQPEVEAVMKKLMLENGITDVLYEGSNVSQLTSIISYVISSLNINTAINLQETILPLATKRMNVLFGARQLGYEPHVKKSFRYKITLAPVYDTSKKTPEGTLDTLNTDKRKINLSTNTKFKSGNKTFYYRGPEIQNLFGGYLGISNYDIQNKNAPGYDIEDFYHEIEIVEGDLLEYTDPNYPELTFLVDSYTNRDGQVVVAQEFLIPFADVEDDGITVHVESPDYGASTGGVFGLVKTERTKSKHFLIDETFTEQKNKFIRQENIILGWPSIFFEYSGLGEPVKVNDKILVDVLISSGADGFAEGDFKFESDYQSNFMEVINNDDQRLPVLTQNGSNGESIDEIKQSAPVFNNTANRAVTRLDYTAITRRNKYVKYSDAWGGEDEKYTNSFPNLVGTPMLGHVWTSTVPYYNKFYDYHKPIYDGVTNSYSLEKYELRIDEPSNLTPTGLYNWYQSGSEIIDPSTNKGTGSIGDILDWLDFYKIITMKLHHRHPLYVDFDYVCDIVKYDLTKSKQEVNKEVFDTMNRYFIDRIEKFDSEYLNSNLQRIVDTTLSYLSGIGFTIKVMGVLFRGMKDETTDIIHCNLDFPFENMYVSNDPNDANDVSGVWLNTDLLPKIDTLQFGEGNKILHVEYSNLNILNMSNNPSGETDILYDGTPIGKYIVQRENSQIELQFDFDHTQTDEIFGTPDKYARFNIIYPFSTGYNHNIPFSRNTIPRLRTVEFKDN